MASKITVKNIKNGHTQEISSEAWEALKAKKLSHRFVVVSTKTPPELLSKPILKAKEDKESK